jgi:ArsR family transcriptional regulator
MAQRKESAGIDKQIYEMHAQMCKVFSSPKRLEIINILRDGEKTVSELIEETGMSKANLSQQLAIMREKGILETRREGQYIHYRLAFPKMLKAYDLLREMFLERLADRGAMAQRFRREQL